MEKLFGQLRSTLHSDRPDAQTWRRILRLIERAPADYAAHTLVPYATELLDAAWPDALRLAPNGWLAAIHAGKTPVGWPLARALRASTHDPLPIALTRGELLATITHIELSGIYTASPNTLAIVRSPALRSLRCFDALGYDASPELLDALLTRHPTLQTLRIGKWQQHLTAPLSRANLPALHTLDLRPLLLTQPIAHDLLYTSALPALRHLSLQLVSPISRDTLRGATLPRQLASLHIQQSSTHAQRPNSADLLHALASTRLDTLTLTSGLRSSDEVDALLSSGLPAPRALILEQINLSDADRVRFTQWSGLDGVQSLTLRSAMHHIQQRLDPLLRAPWAATLRALHLDSNQSIELARTLTDCPLPALESLRLDGCTLGAWPTRDQNSLPALTALKVAAANLEPGSLRAITAAPWLDQLHSLGLGEGFTRSDAGERAALLARCAALTRLHTLDLRALSLRADDLTPLLLATMPALHELRLDAPDGLTPAHLQPLREAAWLPQLAELELPIKRSAELTRHNLRADLLRHGLPRAAHVSY